MSQFLLGRLERCLQLIVSSVSTSCHEFASQFGLEIFLYAKNFKILGQIGWLARVVYFNGPATYSLLNDVKSRHVCMLKSQKRQINSREIH